MRAIRDHGKIAGAERIAVLAALNIASEALSNPPPSTEPSKPGPATSVPTIADEEILRRIRSIDALLDTALVAGTPLLKSFRTSSRRVVAPWWRRERRTDWSVYPFMASGAAALQKSPSDPSASHRIAQQRFA